MEDMKVKILRNGLIVAGHPRSGTSLACQLAANAGVEFLRDTTSDEYNEEGYYELLESKRLEKQLIEQAMTIENTQQLNSIIDQLNNLQNPGLKILRIPALFFYNHLAKNLKVIFVYRNPADVKSSLLRRGISKFPVSWFENNNALIAGYENIQNSIILSYDALINNKEHVKSGFKKLGLEPDFSITQSARQTQSNSRIVPTQEERELYTRLQELEEESCS